MQFIGCEPLQPFEPLIEISSNGKIWDFHNDCDFLGIEYNVQERFISLHWKYYYKNNGNMLNYLIDLNFHKVSAFSISERDSDMPYSEDNCLSSIIFDDIQNNLTIKLQGGQEIKIHCQEMYFSPDVQAKIE